MTRSNIHPSQQRRHCRRSDKLAFLLMALSVYDVDALTLGGRYGFRFNRKSETQMHDSDADADVSSLWKMRSNNHNDNDNRRRNNNNSRGAIIGLDEHSPESIPFGPVLCGGSLADIAIVPLSAAAGSSTAALALEQSPRQNNHPLASTWTNVRSGVQGARRGLVKGVVNLNGVLRGNNRNINNGRQASHVHDGDRRSSSILALDVDVPVHATIIGMGNANTSARANQNINNGLPSMLRMGGMMIQRRLRRRRDASKAASVGALEAMATRMETVDCLDVMGGDIDVWTDHETVSTAYDKVALSSRGGSSVAVYDDSMSASASVSSSISSSSGAAGNNIMADSDAYYVIETPLFPIILPKAWEPPTIASPTYTSGSATTAVSVTSLEISVAVEEDVTSSTTTKPSPQLLQAATQPLLPKDVLDSFTGREFYYPETIEALTTTGMKMTWGQGANPYINWTGEKKTDKFLKDHHNDDNSSDEWYAALDSSQEVLVWAGKFATTAGGGYGAELPIIKTTSIIHKSPKYLTELLMDSERVKVYNKMSLGRVDEKVFQTGVDTQGGAFGDGETKVVRNLTKPPMVSSLLEFVTCMHARKLRPGDTALLSPNDEQYDNNNVSSVEEEPAVEGYVVVSRAVTGGEWSTDTSSSSDSNDNTKRVRNEILLGVNILKAVPGEPNKTELTAVTHVYSPMIPLMLAKNAGVKGAVDFVRDIRALP